MSASAAPFAPPAGTIVPAIAASASVVGRPSASRAQPSGIGFPAFWAIITLPRATWESERSMSNGSPCARGAAKAIGFVP